ncbi:hypothetical protein BUALT_Bualt08G0122800 [Buddleja alternifolia]|uniref:Uncharacterized protein n=1 Tax=Buddleja alternifolia TaxID=168488 RepID=A0AAV6XCC9_9LAMI|nr:hypothetical protein BUALT_Bualt08G0122800 [Buddleja alternifolia]
MDLENQELESGRSGSFGRLSCASCSRRHSLSLSFGLSSQVNDADEDVAVAEAGDIGDRALNSNTWNSSGRSHSSLDNTAGNRTVVPVQEESLSPHSVDAIVQSGDEIKDEKEVPWALERITCLLSLAVFGILGVLTRYCLQKLFGPDIIGATSDESYMYLDLASNVVGSFLMGWLGVVFKGDITKVSDQLAIGLSTGFLGSLTTFSGWNQKMLDLSVKGQWVFAGLGILLGMFLVAYSIIWGIRTAKGFKWLIRRSNIRKSFSSLFYDYSKCISTFMVILLLMLGLLWGLFGSLEKKEFKTGSSEAQLFLACMVGPFGVWIRWFLTRFNGRGLGKNDKLKWMQFGTLAANVLAACVMAALATLKKAVQTKNWDTVASGIQFGLLGCLSTVSTFIAEFHAMRESMQPWRAYAYATTTSMVSFVLGTLIYSVPIGII